MKREDCWYKSVCQIESCSNCIRFAEMSYLMNNSDIPKNKQIPVSLIAGVDIDAYGILADIKDDIVNFVNNGENLYICSDHTGNGKTSWALKLLLKYFDSVWAGNGFRVRGKFVNVPTLLLQLKNFNSPLSEEYKRDIMNCDLVVFDDIGDVNVTNYDYANLFMIVDYRIQSGLSCIFTSNQTTKDALGKLLGNRIASRVWNTSTVIEFKGKDRR